VGEAPTPRYKERVPTALDIENQASLLEYLRATNRIARDETPRFETLAGGVSNRTVLVERASGEAWVIKQALEKLRTKAEWHSDPSRVHREALGIRWLEKLAPPGTITPLVFEDFEHRLIAMQAVPKPHENWKTMLLGGRVRRDHAAQFGELLGTMHRRSHQRRAELEPVFRDKSFFESLRLEPYYEYTTTQAPEATDFLRALIASTRARHACLVHGDYSPKNILVSSGRLILLDHEVVHWGDPAFDLGFALAHLLSKARHLPSHRKALVAAATTFVNSYSDSHLLATVEESRVRDHMLGCLLARVAGRSQLEYLTEAEKERQKRRVLRLMTESIYYLPELFQRTCDDADD